MIEDLKRIAEKVAFSFLGKPYLWGGDDPINGFDCSGLCIEVLKSTGILPRKGDWTAQGLWNRFQEHEVCQPSLGCLVFWTNAKGDKIIHVEMALDHHLCIGASGGGSRTTSKAKAASQNAYIKVRPYRSRKHVRGFLDPFQVMKYL